MCLCVCVCECVWVGFFPCLFCMSMLFDDTEHRGRCFGRDSFTLWHNRAWLKPMCFAFFLSCGLQDLQADCNVLFLKSRFNFFKWIIFATNRFADGWMCALMWFSVAEYFQRFSRFHQFCIFFSSLFFASEMAAQSECRARLNDRSGNSRYTNLMSLFVSRITCRVFMCWCCWCGCCCYFPLFDFRLIRKISTNLEPIEPFGIQIYPMCKSNCGVWAYFWFIHAYLEWRYHSNHTLDLPNSVCKGFPFWFPLCSDDINAHARTCACASLVDCSKDRLLISACH